MLIADEVFRVIAHPARRSMIALLARADHSVKELTAEFEMSQPAVSQHLRALRSARLVMSTKVGTEQRYRLTPKPLELVEAWSVKMRRLKDPAGHVWALGSAAQEKTAGRSKHGS